jgi:hypothetical protein
MTGRGSSSTSIVFCALVVVIAYAIFIELFFARGRARRIREAAGYS